MKMKCPKCDCELFQGDRYCGNCGAPVAETIAGHQKASPKKISVTEIDRLWKMVGKYEVEEDWESLQDTYLKLVKIDSLNPASFTGLGLSFLRTGKTDSAFEQINQAIEIDPDYAEAHVALGDALGVIFASDDAVIAYKRAIELDRNNYHAYVALGKQYLDQDESWLNQAERCFLTAKRINPNKAAPFAGLGEVNLRKKKYNEARECIQYSLKLDRNNEDALRLQDALP